MRLYLKRLFCIRVRLQGSDYDWIHDILIEGSCFIEEYDRLLQDVISELIETLISAHRKYLYLMINIILRAWIYYYILLCRNN